MTFPPIALADCAPARRQFGGLERGAFAFLVKREINAFAVPIDDEQSPKRTARSPAGSPAIHHVLSIAASGAALRT